MRSALKIIGIVLVVLGVMALGFGGTFTFTEVHDAGPFTWHERETVNYPAWGGLGLIAIGAAMYVLAPTARKAA